MMFTEGTVSLVVFWFWYLMCVNKKFLTSCKKGRVSRIEKITVGVMSGVIIGLGFKACIGSCYDPDLGDAIQIIRSRGFHVQVYYPMTSDGYILCLHRIINPRIPKSQRKRPVMIQHGLIESSADFLINSAGEHLDQVMENPAEGRNLGFTLSRVGYDVWLSNSRGNRYSRYHKTLDPNKDKKYWEFSWDEHALIDLPTFIDFILKKTKSPTIGYVGHSQGTMTLYALMSRVDKYNHVIRPFVALAPVATFNDIRSPIKYLNTRPIPSLLRVLGGEEFLPSSQLKKSLARKVCTKKYLDQLCSNTLFLISGYNPKQLNMSRLDVYFAHDPAGTSCQNMLHYNQALNSPVVKMFDFGSVERNFQKYNSSQPPIYDFTQISNQYLAVMTSKNDWLAGPKDIQWLKHQLRNSKGRIIEDFEVEDPDWSHLDFLWGKDAGKIINSRIVKLLDQYA